MRYVAIGDVHGCKDRLERLLVKLDVYANHNLVFLGDYVDVGPDAKGVIQLLIDLVQNRPFTRVLAGNHELEMLAYIESGDFVRYAKRGGLATIRSYCGQVTGDVHAAFCKAVPDEHTQFLRSLETFYETNDFLFSHAGYDPESPLDRSLQSTTTVSHASLLSGQGTFAKTAVCGHYFQKEMKPMMLNNLIALDTGCGVLGGPLTAVELPTRTVIQSD
jgi:serine/threonine protein phosphatase 1